jgi:hypothetical protein
MVTNSDESVYVSGVIETAENECISGDRTNATMTTMHPISCHHQTAGNANTITGYLQLRKKKEVVV